jgi:tetratricopeptide (TPR) repeat protein
MHILEKAKKFDTWAGGTLLIGVALTLVGFIPMLGLSLGSTKSFFLIISSTIAFLFWLIARSIDGTFVFPKTKVFFVYIAVVIAGILSTIFSTQTHESFIGKNFETTTLAILLALFVTTFLALTYFREVSKVTRLYKILIAGFLVVSIFTLVRVFLGAGSVSLNLFSAATDTLVGSWIDFALFTGVATTLSLLALEFLPLPKKKKMFVMGVFGLSMIVGIIANVTLVWMFVAGASLLSFIFLTIFNKRGESGETHDNSEIVSPIGALVGARNVPFLSLSTFIISLFFVLTAQSVGTSISNLFGVSYAEVRPSITATATITKEAFAEHPLFGAGLNRFTALWATNKTPDVMATPYWNVDFSVGSGYIPTQIATGGAVGALTWILLCAVFVVLFVRKIFAPWDTNKSPKEHYVYFTTLLLGMFGFLTLFFYIPGACMLSLSALFLALFVAIHCIGTDGYKVVSILKNNKRAFFGLALLLVFMLATLYFGFIVVKKQIALMYEARGTVMAARGDVDGAENAFMHAGRLSPDDSVYQALSQIAFARINTLLSTEGLSQETMQAEFQNKFALAEGFALQSIAYDNGSFRNWIFLGDIYKAFAPLDVSGAYEGAQTAYAEAGKIVPANPLVTLRSADLERANGNTEKARALGTAALDQKANYLEAVFFLAQLERSVGNKMRAYELESIAGALDPNNSELFYQLGLIAYNTGETTRAITSFERSVLLNPRFSDARFMLAVVYEQAGRRSDALSVLVALQKDIPDNTDLAGAIERVKRGGSVLTGTTVQQTVQETTPVVETETEEPVETTELQ